MKRIILTGGGTAGHVNPAVALAHIFKARNPGCRVLFVGADGGMENKLVPKEGYQIQTVTITNFRRSFAPADIAHNLGTLVNMSRSKRQAKAILDEFRPDLVVGTGDATFTLGDVNGDGKVDAKDRAALSAALGSTRREDLLPYDLSGDGVIDIVEGHVLIGVSRLVNAMLLIVCIAVGLSATLLMIKDSLL